MLGGVNYYSGAVFDFEKITAVAREHGIFIGFDMAHAAGNVKMNLSEAGPDFACWCTYKYLNAGPGSLSGIYINQRHLGKRDIPRFEGWWGHDKHERFKMKKKFRPMATAEAWQLSNPPILPMACIKASLDIFSEAGMANVAKKGKKLSGFLIEKLDALESRKVEIISPRDEQYRGAQVSIRVKNADKSLFDRMTEAGIVADWREPDVIRVAPCALYNTFEEVERFVAIFADCLQSKTISHEK